MMYKVGDIRPTQLLHTYGVGAMIDLPNIAALVMGLEDWDTVNATPVGEERLLKAVRSMLGTQVQKLLLPPIELIAPVRYQLLHVAKVRAVLPAGAVDLVGETRPGQPLLQIAQHLVGHVDLERDDGWLREACRAGREKEQKRWHDGQSLHRSSDSPVLELMLYEV